MSEITYQQVREDIAAQIQYLEQKFRFSEFDLHGDFDSRYPRAGGDKLIAFGEYKALKGLLWRFDNPGFLGRV